MLTLRVVLLLSLGVIFQFLCAERALAWGPGVHMVIALSSFEEVSLLLPAIASMITSFPVEYLYGCLAVDVVAHDFFVPPRG
jgi:hypothetical protein